MYVIGPDDGQTYGQNVGTSKTTFFFPRFDIFSISYTQFSVVLLLNLFVHTFDECIKKVFDWQISDRDTTLVATIYWRVIWAAHQLSYIRRLTAILRQYRDVRLSGQPLAIFRSSFLLCQYLLCRYLCIAVR